MSDPTERARHIVENGGLLAKDTALKLIEQLEAAEKRVAEMQYSDYLQWHAMPCKNGERAEKAEAELARRDAAAREPFAYHYRYAGCETRDGFQDWRYKLTRESPPEWMIETGKVTDVKELFDAPQSSAEPIAYMDSAHLREFGWGYIFKEIAPVGATGSRAEHKDPIYAAAQSAALPPEIHTRQAIERLEKEDAPGSVNVAYKWGYNKAIADAKALGCQPPKEFFVKLPDDLPDDGYNTAAMCNWARNEMKKKCAEAIRAAGGSVDSDSD